MLTPRVLFQPVFSAHAEVVPMLRRGGRPVSCILRARGGSSPFRPFLGKPCQVFSAHAEVVP